MIEPMNLGGSAVVVAIARNPLRMPEPLITGMADMTQGAAFPATYR